VADRLKEIATFSSKQAQSDLLFNTSPEGLVDACLKALRNRN
jgi:hypothetical protein